MLGFFACYLRFIPSVSMNNLYKVRQESQFSTWGVKNIKKLKMLKVYCQKVYRHITALTFSTSCHFSLWCPPPPPSISKVTHTVFLLFAAIPVCKCVPWGKICSHFTKAEASAKQKSVRGVHSALQRDLHNLPCDRSAELSVLSVTLFVNYDLLLGMMYFPLKNKVFLKK